MEINKSNNINNSENEIKLISETSNEKNKDDVYIDSNVNNIPNLNEVQKNVIDNLFMVNGLKCRKLYYGNLIFFCLVDIFDCFDYKQLNTTFLLHYLDDSDMFTIDALQELYKDEIDNDINKEVIESLNKYEKRYTYINQSALIELVNYTSKEHKLNFFYTFVYNKLIPTVHNIFYNPVDDKQMVNGVINIIEQNEENNKKLFLIYKTSSNTYTIRDNVQPELLNQGIIKKENIIIQDDSGDIDFYNCLKEEGFKQSRQLKRSIIFWLRSINPEFKKTFDANAEMINRMFNQVRPYKISGNNLFLNNNKIEDIIDIYNRFKNSYIFY